MTVAVARTKVEQALTESFEAVAGALPGSGFVREARRRAIGTFAALGLPHRRIEEWKYTDLRALLKEAFAPSIARTTTVNQRALDAALAPAFADLDAIRIVFVDGAFAPALTRLDDGHGSSYRFDPLARGLAEGFDWLEALLAETDGPKGGAVIALNTAFATDGTMLRVVDGARLAKPVHLIFATSGGEKRAVTTRNFLRVGAGAEAVVVESHVAIGAEASQHNTVTEIAVGDGARVQHLKVLAGIGDSSGPAASAHIGTWLARLGAESEYRAFHLTAGMPLVRNQLLVAFAGEGAKLDISGCFLGRGTEHIDTTLVVDHAVPGCESRELFKGVLADRARGVFQGKVIVRPNAQKTDGKQMAQALMLSEDAEFDSKPELEIHADDVICGHGSTAAEIDTDMLFYLCSRGIAPEDARALLIESFLGEALDKVADEGLRAALSGIVKGRLAALAACGDARPATRAEDQR
jgi:Fe-S cluster assembly protein SufD